MNNFTAENFKQPSIKKKELVRDSEIIDMVPEKLASDVPVLVSPGWGNIVSSVKENAFSELVGQGRRVLSTDFPRSLGVDNDGRPHAEILQKALTLLEVLEKKSLDETSAIGHSEGY